MLWIHAGAGNISDMEMNTREGVRMVCGFYSQYFNEDLYITHITAGIHSDSSFHPFGRAFDIRYPQKKFTNVLKKKIKQLLHTDFDIVFEKNHIHIEYDPIINKSRDFNY